MANGEEKCKSKDFYEVLGLNKECTAIELKNAYKKLALRWHPDRCSYSANSNSIEEAKNRFQAIQQAYSVLSDDHQRFLYDLGVYDSDDDENGMGDFLSEMAVMMSQTKPSEPGEESFEQLQELFEELFQGEIESFIGNLETTNSCSTSYNTNCESSNSNRSSVSPESESRSGKLKEDSSSFHSNYQKFSLRVEHHQDFKKVKGASSRRQGRKQKVSQGHGVTSID